MPRGFPQKVAANDDVKGFAVQHSTVLRHGFFAKTNRHNDTPQGMDFSTIHYSYPTYWNLHTSRLVVQVAIKPVLPHFLSKMWRLSS